MGLSILGMMILFDSFNSDEDGMTAVTMWVVADFEKVSGRKLLLNALKHVVSIIQPQHFACKLEDMMCQFRYRL